jgi:NAD(P)-dependent dehydrogenase (short-subunit alcohol dehydrogenase family)
MILYNNHARQIAASTACAWIYDYERHLYRSLTISSSSTVPQTMSIAVIQGASGGLGLNLAAHILRHTSMKVYALTHQNSTTDLERHLEQSSESNQIKDRLTVLGGIDNTQEDTLSKASKTIEEREGKASVRLIACLAGIVGPPSPFPHFDPAKVQLHPEKSLSAFDAKAALETFNVNTIGHLLTYKHFVPLIPTRKESSKRAG